MEWDLIFNYSGYICWDAIEEENRYLILISNNYYSYILSVEKNLEQPTYNNIASFNHSFSGIVEGNNQYVLFRSMYSNVIGKLTISGDYVSTSTSSMSYQYYYNAYNDAFIIDNFLYFRNSNKYIIKYDLLNEVSYNTYSSCENICYKDDKIYALSSNGIILKFDLDLNLLKQGFLANLNGLYASEDCLLSLDLYDGNLHFIDYDSLNIYFSQELNIDETITTCGYSTFYDNESLIKVGYNSFYDPYYIEFNINHSIYEYEEKECQINDTISFDQHLDNVSFLNEYYEIIFNEESIINTNFDNSQAGIYRYDYLVQTKLGEEVKYFMLSKNVLVNYRTSLVNNEIYVGGVYLDIEGADIYIDGEKYEQGDFYNVEGNTEIILVGQNGYQKTLNITILPGIKNVEDGKEYTESVTPIFSGNNTTLNGEYIAPGTTITKVGNYKLIHTDKRGNETHCYFTIKENISGIEDGLITNNGLRIYAENCSMSINDKEYLSGDYFNELGKNHQLKVSGEGGYESFYTFTILPDFDDIIVKSTSYSFEINVDEEFLDYLTIMVNNEEINKTTTYETFGKYVIKITLTEDIVFSEELKEFYNREYVKYIEPIIYINDTLYSGWDKSQLGEEDIFLGYFGVVENLGIKYNSNSETVENIIEQPYTEIGLYNDIKVTIGDYTQTFSFCIEDPIMKLEDFYLEQFVIEKDSELFKLLFNGEYKVFLDGEYLEVKIEEPKVEGDEEKEPSDNEEIQDINKKELLIEERIFCNQIGAHTLSIEGPNGFYKELKFNIVLGELNYISEEYTIIIPNVIEKVELNGVEVPIFENQYLIKFTKLGNNIVKIYGSNGYQTTREYKIGDEVLGLDEDKVALDFPNLNFKDGFEFVKLVIDNGKFEFLYNEMDQFKEFDNYGNHTLKIIGVNGYESKAYTFSVEYDFNKSGINQYNDTFITFIDYDKFENVLIDGVKYDFSNNNRYYVLGPHTITLIGANAWEKTNSFTICHETDKLLDSTLTENQILYYNDGKMEFNFEGICDEIMIDDIAFDALKGDITSIGFHDITLSIGDYDYTYRICVEPNVSMYDNIVFYDYAVLNIPNVTDTTDVTIMINDEETRSRIFSEIGNYNVMIKGSKDYVKTFKFTIKEVLNGLIEDEEVEIEKTYFVVPSLPADILVDNVPKREREIVSEGGKHTITVLGVGGYSAVYTFIIPFDYSVDGNILKSNGGEIFVNGVLVPQNYQLTSIGNNIVQFVGANGYPVEEIEVKIDHKIKIADGGTYKNGLLVPIVDGKVYIDDVEIFEETMIYRHGNHTIKIVGTNDYVAEINVYIKNSNTVIAYVLCVPAALCLVGFVIILIRRKRVL